MHFKSFLLGFTLFFCASGILNAKSSVISRESTESYASFIVCIDIGATVYFFEGYSAKKAVALGFSDCGTQFNEYMSHIAVDLEKKIGKALSQEEIQRTKERVRYRTIKQFEEIYSGRIGVN